MDSRVRIMVLGVRGFPGVQGGVETHAENLYPLLVRLGCEIEVITRSQYIQSDVTKWRGIRYHPLWAPRVKGLEALVHSFLGVLYAGVKRPEILHIHAVGPAVVVPLARVFRLRVVVTHHGPDYEREKWGPVARWMLRMGERFGMCFSSERIAISEVIRDLIQRRYGRNSVVIPNGVILPAIPTSRVALHKFGLMAGRYVLLVSRLVPEKRHLDLINAFVQAGLAGWKLVLVGGTDHPDRYSRMVLSVGESEPDVVLTGFQSGCALGELYANAGIFVLPSSHEGLPIVLLEALSYGIPVVASAIPANLEVGLPSECYFPLGDTGSLAEILRRFGGEHLDPARCLQRREWVKARYDWKRIAEKTLEVYRAALIT